MEIQSINNNFYTFRPKKSQYIFKKNIKIFDINLVNTYNFNIISKAMIGTDVSKTLFRERNPKTAERFLIGRKRYSPMSRRVKELE